MSTGMVRRQIASINAAFILTLLLIRPGWAQQGSAPVAPGTATPINPASGVPYQPLPEYQEKLRTVRVVGNVLDRMTPETIFWDWLGREAVAGKVLQSIPLESARDMLIPGRNRQIPARVYTPADKQLAHDGKLPVIVYFHGGGWSLGSINSHDSITRALAEGTPAIVVSVDYRLGPECPFPAAVHDAYTATQWVGLHAAEFGGDPTRLAVAGDSGGGNLATVVALIARDKAARGEPVPAIKLQALFYPSVNISDTNYPSYQQYGVGYLLTKRAVELFRGFYLPKEEDWVNPYASPLLARDLSGMAPMLLVAAGCDPLRDEGKAYADRLAHAKVKVDYRLKEGFIHGFLSDFNREPKALSDQVKKVIDESTGAMRDALR
ncbi:MAG: alpha/beta hydrolase fold domain-containing protein [Bacillota bacterium]